MSKVMCTAIHAASNSRPNSATKLPVIILAQLSMLFKTKRTSKSPLCIFYLGATLKLECSDPITRNVTYSIEGVTDSNGHYKLKVKGDYGDNICEVTLNKSPEAECNVPMVGQQTSRIVCTENSGMHDSVRYANALGFMTKNSISGCKEVLDELGLAPKDLDL